MLDIRRIRSEPDKVREGIAAKGASANLDRWLELDDRRRALTTEWQERRAELNAGGEKISAAKKEGRDATEAIAAMKAVKASERELRSAVEELEVELADLLIRVPNLPADDVPRGPDESANVEEGRWGAPAEFDFDPRPHWEIGADLGILDLEAGGKVAGSGFPVLRGAGAALERALIQFMLDVHTREHGYTEIAVPYLSRAEPMVACGQIPKLEADMYRIEKDGLYLIPTGEVPLTNLHRGEILSGDDLPKRYVTMTPCFRREAGAAGRDTRGLIRVHQFHKVELMQFVREEDSDAELTNLRGHAEEILRRLGLHYQVMKLCTGDLSFAGHRAFDLNVWAPGVGKYLEVSSATMFRAFQARRANTRYRGEDGKLRFAHTMNGSALALPRTLVAVIETYQQSDGSVRVPEVLAPYLNGAERIGGGNGD